MRCEEGGAVWCGAVRCGAVRCCGWRAGCAACSSVKSPESWPGLSTPSLCEPISSCTQPLRAVAASSARWAVSRGSRSAAAGEGKG